MREIPSWPAGGFFPAAAWLLQAFLCTVLISEKVGLGFGAVSVLLSVLGCLLMLPICVNGKERNYHVEHEEETFTLREMLRYLIHNKYLLLYYGGSVISGSLALRGRWVCLPPIIFLVAQCLIFF